MKNVEVFQDCCQKLNMQLFLQIPAGPVKFPNTDFYIFQEASWEILIEKHLFNSIGIDGKEQLFSLAENQHQFESYSGAMKVDKCLAKDAKMVEENTGSDCLN